MRGWVLVQTTSDEVYVRNREQTSKFSFQNCIQCHPEVHQLKLKSNSLISNTSLSFQTTSLAHFADILVIDRPRKNQTSAGYCERPFDSLKSFYRAISADSAALNREHFFISAVVQLCLSPSIGDPERALRYAWKTLRYDFPQTAAYG